MNVDTAALRKLAEAATPGPWHPEDRDIGWEVHQTGSVDDPGGCYGRRPDGERNSHLNLTSDYKGTLTEGDARFVAAARNALPALLDRIDTLSGMDVWPSPNDAVAVEALARELCEQMSELGVCYGWSVCRDRKVHYRDARLLLAALRSTPATPAGGTK